ncbi:hypothetical protein OG439_24470 [Amycolatopsis sp. NBC_01307]|uniref:hypothetical protein n=1 Tax=Amycolatopsis sp. NBC_01307 TaxID=2903561 RepID=UPI002E157367|nr:hypothetical protein OG439_24470 [Amycolatopsis sp. NBC_01307]
MRAEGAAPAEALQTIRNRIEGAWGSSYALVGFDIVRTLTCWTGKCAAISTPGWR